MSVITNTVAKLATNVVSKEVDALQKQIQQLRSMNNQLQEAVSLDCRGTEQCILYSKECLAVHTWPSTVVLPPAVLKLVSEC